MINSIRKFTFLALKRIMYSLKNKAVKYKWMITVKTVRKRIKFQTQDEFSNAKVFSF